MENLHNAHLDRIHFIRLSFRFILQASLSRICSHSNFRELKRLKSHSLDDTMNSLSFSTFSFLESSSNFFENFLMKFISFSLTLTIDSCWRYSGGDHFVLSNERRWFGSCEGTHGKRFRLPLSLSLSCLHTLLYPCFSYLLWWIAFSSDFLIRCGSAKAK